MIIWRSEMKSIDVIIFCGQSNMQGQSETLISRESVAGAYEYKYLTNSFTPPFEIPLARTSSTTEARATRLTRAQASANGYRSTSSALLVTDTQILFPNFAKRILANRAAVRYLPFTLPREARRSLIGCPRARHTSFLLRNHSRQ